MSEPNKFRIAIIGSGPVGKLMIASVKPHPRIEYVQFEADTLPLQPSFGYGVGPQTLSTTKILNPVIGKELYDQCIIGPVWMNFRHGGEEDTPLPTIEVPSGVYGRIGREELLDLLDSFRPDGHAIHFGKRLRSVTKESGLLNLKFEDGTQDHVNAIWACDGMNSLCRKVIQGESYKPATYSGMIAFRGKADSKKIEALGEGLASETHMFIGVPGWHVLTFPIAGGKLVNIAAFAVEKSQKTRSRAYKANKDEVLGYFPGANETVKGFLRLLAEEEDMKCLDLTFMENLGAFFNEDLCITSFGDAANGMLPHIAGSMSTGFIGVTTYLHGELNPRLGELKDNASDKEIADVLTKAAFAYEVKHRPLAQKLVNYSAEQGTLWAGGVLDGEKLSFRPRFLWQAAGSQAEV